MSGLLGVAFFGWFAVRPHGVARSQMEWHARVWGRILRGWPEIARFFGLQIEDGDPRFTDSMARFWVGFVRFTGILGVVFGVGLMVQGIAKVT